MAPSDGLCAGFSAIRRPQGIKERECHGGCPLRRGTARRSRSGTSGSQKAGGRARSDAGRRLIDTRIFRTGGPVTAGPFHVRRRPRGHLGVVVLLIRGDPCITYHHWMSSFHRSFRMSLSNGKTAAPTGGAAASRCCDFSTVAISLVLVLCDEFADLVSHAEKLFPLLLIERHREAPHPRKLGLRPSQRPLRVRLGCSWSQACPLARRSWPLARRWLGLGRPVALRCER